MLKHMTTGEFQFEKNRRKNFITIMMMIFLVIYFMLRFGHFTMTDFCSYKQNKYFPEYKKLKNKKKCNIFCNREYLEAKQIYIIVLQKRRNENYNIKLQMVNKNISKILI